ncbi:hypothetical protein [Streptomyces sp. NPDC056061]|uniref:hypothetical protein n=1 Tax=Streptomyces sp. NPDC056061 TaxID=3345700 RepID=UPI0035D840D0
MRQSLRYLLFATGTGVSVLAMAAVHGATHLPLPIALYADGVIGVCWLFVTVPLLRRRSPDAPDGEAHGSGLHRAVRFSVDGEPLARSHWGDRHRH